MVCVGGQIRETNLPIPLSFGEIIYYWACSFWAGNDGKCVTDKDVESDEAVWALYERWCKSFNKERDHAEMVRRFYIFRFEAWTVHGWNSYVHKDLYALDHAKKQRDLGKHVCDWYLQQELCQDADGGSSC
uniref:Uncharacterized protein n=1 Tax=Leersia perrieri TaxID=77586 RepID=A0A0D9Y1Q0_9ORYZ